MHQPSQSSGGGSGGAVALCLLWLATGACSGSNTDAINRDIRSARPDASEEEVDAPVVEDAALEEDAATPDPVEEEDASEPVAMDAQLPADSAVSESDAGSASDAATAPDAGDSAPADAGQDAALPPGATVPKNYLRAADSPFSGVDFAYFHLEDFEDHTLSTPGLRSVSGPLSTTAAGVLSSSFGASLIDSVDGDDGIPTDNRCQKSDGGICDAWWGPGTLTFSFDTSVLGALPTHVGGVWTDGVGEVSFEAFGPDGVSIYKVGPLSEPGFPDDTVSSSTAEDRFFGAYSPAGISAFTVSNTSGGVEVDHVQYGRAR